MPAKTLMIQGTSSSVGKSLLVAALCRVYARRGVRVAPFKAQNMSNNAAVCADGEEIGRAQAVQAVAAGIAPTPDLNPILLKPEGNSRCQVIVQGRPWKTLAARSYYGRKEALWPIVTAALQRLRAAYDLVIIEGAGSPVELNLKASDIVNMAVARHASAPVLLVGDIDRGGIFAQMLGTLWLLDAEERARVRGLIVNKFRGDRTLFADGVRILEERGQAPVLGVLPYLPALVIPEEDAVSLDTQEMCGVRSAESGVDVAVVRLPHIANFDDFDPLVAEPSVQLRYVETVAALGRPQSVILPGTKSTMADLAWLRERGLDTAIRVLAERGSAVVGICGGYQMLGQVIRDPEGVESTNQECRGLGLLPVETVFAPAKSTHLARARILGGAGWLNPLVGEYVDGYEIHMGRSWGGQPWLEIDLRGGRPANQPDGAVDASGRVWGCYLHGLFANDNLRRAWLASLAQESPGKIDHGATESAGPTAPSLQAALDRLADAVEERLDFDRLDGILAEC